MDHMVIGGAASLGDSSEFEKEANLSLSDRIKVFKSSQFDADAFINSKCRNMAEKELQKASAEEMRKSVYANYSAFIRTAKEISLLEGQLLSLRNLLSAQATVVHGLADGVHVNSLSPGTQGPSDEDISKKKNSELSKIETWLSEFLETLEVLQAERRVEEALSALDEAEKVVEDANERGSLRPTMLISLQNAITGSRLKLADQLIETASQSSIKGAERRALVFSTIGQASSDSLTVFGEDNSYTSELVTWAVKQTEQFSVLVKRQCLTQSAASGNLRAAAGCVQICLGHCSLLESSGLALSPVLLKDFKPLVEQALSANLKRIEQNCAALASADDWSLTLHPPGGSAKLSNSAHRFYSMVQDLFEGVEPLVTLQLVSPLLEGLVQVFNSYVNTLINAFPVSMNEANIDGGGVSIVKVAETEAQQLALLANALLLADECLPRAAAKLLPSSNQGNKNDEPCRTDLDRQNRVAEQRDWKKRLQKSVDRLRDSFCRQHALELIFTDEGELRLTAHLYTRLDGFAEEPEWFPSSIFQFYLDMEFVMLFASQGRFLSRNLQQVAKNIISRAIDAVSASGIDPYNSLPEDEWFVEVAQTAVNMLTGQSN
ncbi:Exocyst complex component EXO84A, partial [Bienertia sinuspersici]